jgi:hypothetical protein
LGSIEPPFVSGYLSDGELMMKPTSYGSVFCFQGGG